MYLWSVFRTQSNIYDREFCRNSWWLKAVIYLCTTLRLRYFSGFWIGMWYGMLKVFQQRSIKKKASSRFLLFICHCFLKKKLREILNLQIYASLLLQKIAEPSIRESLLPKFSILPRKSIFNQISTGKRALKVITILIEIFLSRIRSILNSYSVQSQQ